jgi:hypothetical protein
MVWKAKINISDYKAGDIVPDEIAETWNIMYKVSPVEFVQGSSAPKSVDMPIVEAKVLAKKNDLMDDGKRNYSNKKPLPVKRK